MKTASEAIGAALLTLAVVGSGIMAQSLSEDVGIQLLINSLATVAVLFILINLLAPLSGAHFNPAVTLVALFKREISIKNALVYIFAQFIGALTGIWIAHLIFDRTIFEFATKERIGTHLFFSEIIATAGLILIIFAKWSEYSLNVRAAMISLWIGAGYFFTSSTSFANPAVTIARAFTDTFSGIAPGSVGSFIVAQLIGASLAFIFLLRVQEMSAK